MIRNDIDTLWIDKDALPDISIHTVDDTDLIGYVKLKNLHGSNWELALTPKLLIEMVRDYQDRLITERKKIQAKNGL